MRQIGCINVFIFLRTPNCASSLQSSSATLHSLLLSIKFNYSIILHHLMIDNRGTVAFNQIQVKGNQCMHGILGTFIDIRWNKNSGIMDISPTKHEQFSHCKGQTEESFFYVPLKHGANCPLLNNNIAKNDKRPMRPCSVVLIQDKNASIFLATQRPLNISFGGKWVLPGGHLQVGQGIIEGGIRQCVEEVGLQKESVVEINIKQMMAWESVYAVDSEIKSTGLVLFFRIKSDKFEVKPQEGQIQKWEWRSLDNDPWGGGWAQGHLTYLRYISSLQR